MHCENKYRIKIFNATQLALPVHVGGKTAIELKGYAHYLSAKQNRVFLFGPRGLILPSWFTEDRFGVKFVVTIIRPYLEALL
ncbi:MAG: AbiEi antitoxin N-terminal domain-containing protein [Desulfatirhabdiaceae bacterium]|nr:AbiEi antitoxin N-terminal domain-containing protein [Desulfatirhabdiaceae bacterium]